MYPITLTLLVHRLGMLMTTGRLKKNIITKKNYIYLLIKSYSVASVAWVIKYVGVFLHLSP